MSVSVNSSYTTSLSALFLGSLLPTVPGTGGEAPPIVPVGILDPGSTGTGGTGDTPVAALSGYASDYAIYGARAGYRLSKDLTLNGGFQHMTQQYGAGHASQSNSETGSVAYGHKLFGGQMSAHATLMKFSFSAATNSSSLAYSLGGGFSRDMGHWHHSADLQYSKSNTQTATTTLVNGYGLGVNSGRRFGKFRLNLNGRLSQNSFAGFADTQSTSESFSAALGTAKYGFSGSYSKNNGNSLQTAAGLQPISIPGAVLLPDLLVLYKGSAYSFAGTYNPMRRFKITGDYTRSQYETTSGGAVSNNRLEQMNVKSEYNLRLLSISAGFSRITQALGITTPGTKTPTVTSYYIGISRHFDFF